MESALWFKSRQLECKSRWLGNQVLKTNLGFHPPPLNFFFFGSKFKVVTFWVSCQQYISLLYYTSNLNQSIESRLLSTKICNPKFCFVLLQYRPYDETCLWKNTHKNTRKKKLWKLSGTYVDNVDIKKNIERKNEQNHLNLYIFQPLFLMEHRIQKVI